MTDEEQGAQPSGAFGGYHDRIALTDLLPMTHESMAICASHQLADAWPQRFAILICPAEGVAVLISACGRAWHPGCRAGWRGSTGPGLFLSGRRGGLGCQPGRGPAGGYCPGELGALGQVV